MTALRSVGFPVPTAVVRLGGAGEALVGGAAVATGWRPLAAVVAGFYLGFVAYVSLHLVRGDAASSCGCFGDSSATPNAVHLGVNIAGAAAGAAAVVWPVPGVATAVRESPLEGLAMAGFVTLGCWFTYLAMTGLPRLDVAGAARAAAGPSPAREVR